uniref:UBA domain-containing protein n=2 Tax=Noccaea caerulescens TaxID=107243 RepID=A0A1J3K435_NOCCA
MSPATKSKSKEKKTGIEAQKASPKPAVSMNGNSSMAANAYNPLLGRFQVLDSVSVASATPIHYGRFRSIDEVDVNGIESDSVSNNGSCSGESEDHKEKTTNLPLRQEVIPGADNDKREKVRQKNERKHQRQKERRAQELYEKCSTYLMSRKLEALTQQLVAMGISHEHATTALMMNQGKVEESVHWLFDRGEEEIDKQSTQSPGNLKIDITEELARITQMEVRLKCTRQEIERAVVQAEGDLDRAEEVMKGTKFDELSVLVKQEESGDPVTASNGNHLVGIGNQNSDAERRETQSAPLPVLQPTRDDKSFNYTKSPPSTAEPGNKMVQTMKRPQPKLDWPKPQQSAVLVDKRWTNTGQVPSASYSLPSSPSPSPQPSVRVETRYIASGNEFKNLQQQPSNREPVVAMRQRPQAVSTTNPVPTSSMSVTPTSWLPSASIEIMKSNGFTQSHNIPSARSPSPNNNLNLSPNQIYQQLQYQNQKRLSNNNLMDPHGSMARGNGNLWTRNNTASLSPSISAASSLGLFSAVGSAGTSGPPSPIDWSSGGSVDYTSIDWSLDQGLCQNTRFNGIWSESKSSSHMYDPNMNRYSLKGSMGGRVNSGNDVLMESAGVGVAVETKPATSQDWTSPFEGKDFFSLSRQYVSPSL